MNNGALTFEEVAAKYPQVSRFVIRKIDTTLRGITLTGRALSRARELNALFEDIVEEHGKQVKREILGGAVFRDGTTLMIGIGSMSRPHGTQDDRGPYIVDLVDDRLVLVDSHDPVEEVYLVPIPDYYGKKTGRGTPMHHVVSVGPPDCLTINVYGYCDFWSQKKPCKYCTFQVRHQRAGGKTEDELADLYETVSEALREPGRWTAIRLTGGSDPSGATPYDSEVNEHVKVLQTLGRCFGSKGIPARVVASAFPKEQLLRLVDAGATTYEPHLEVWDEKLFEWVCPGKAKWFGRQYWIDSAIAAVEVFGRGNVCSQFVGGAEMAQPYGFKTIDAAVASTLQGVEYFAEHGVTTTLDVLRDEPGSVFHKQKQKRPPLEYHVKLARGMREIRRKHRLGVDFNDYRRCAIHPDTDLSRLDYPEVEI